MIGKILEIIWTIIKIAVVLVIVTIGVGSYVTIVSISRGNLNQRKEESYYPAVQIIGNRNQMKNEVEAWILTAKKEKVTMVADDGKQLIAMKIFNTKANGKWAIILHGYDSDKRDVYDIALHYYEGGFNVLVPDLRAHGESEGTYIGMGWLDRLDVINWIDTILEEELSANIVIHGVGMGGATALMMSGEPLKNNIKAIVSDGSYTSAWELCKSELKQRRNLPAFPVLHMTLPMAKLLAHYNFKEASAINQVKKARQPILIIHGEQDDYVDVKMANKLFEATASSKDKLMIQDGGRADARYAQPELYYNKVFSFVSLYVN